MKILFISHNRLGDAVLSTCILNLLHQKHPGAKFTIVTGRVPAEMFSAVPNLECLIIIKKAKYHLHWLKLWAKCLFNRWDIVVDCRGSAISWLLWTKQRFYKYPANSKSMHRVLRYNGMLKQQKPTPPKVWIDAKHQAIAKKLIGQHKTILAIGPAANWRAKTWRDVHFIELIKQLRAADGLLPNAAVAVIAAPNERDQVQSVIDSIPKQALIDLVGTADLLTIAGVIQQSTLYIGNDSGLMHMAAAVGTPTLGLFGPTDAGKYAPFGDNGHTVRTKQSPEELMDYPDFHWLTCDSLMDSINVSDVMLKIKKIVD